MKRAVNVSNDCGNFMAWDSHLTCSGFPLNMLKQDQVRGPLNRKTG